MYERSMGCSLQDKISVCYPGIDRCVVKQAVYISHKSCYGFLALDILSIIVGGAVDYSGAGWSLYEIRVPVRHKYL